MATFGAGADIVFVEKIASVAFFAKAFKPMFADEVVGAVSDRMFVWAEGPQGAVAFAEGFAVGAGGGDTEAVFFAEEGGKGEGWGEEALGRCWGGRGLLLGCRRCGGHDEVKMLVM